MTNNEAPNDDDPLLPSPADAIDVPKDLKTGLEFHCELDEYAAFVHELRQSGIVKDHRPGGLLSKKFKDSFSGLDFVNWVMEAKNVDKEKAIEMGQNLISRKFGHGVHTQEVFKCDPDALYQLGSAALGSALNNDKINNCAQRPATEVAEDLRKLILKIYAVFLSNDGKSVDYAGIRGTHHLNHS